jgi:hypothetical protein
MRGGDPRWDIKGRQMAKLTILVISYPESLAIHLCSRHCFTGFKIAPPTDDKEVGAKGVSVWSG